MKAEKPELVEIWIWYLTVSEASESDKVKVRTGVVLAVQEPLTMLEGPKEEGAEGAELTKVQLVLFPESTELVPIAFIGVAFILLESLTSKKAMVLAPCGSIIHWVPLAVLRRDKRVLVEEP